MSQPLAGAAEDADEESWRMGQDNAGAGAPGAGAGAGASARALGAGIKV